MSEPTIEVVGCGTQEFPRYRITNNKGQYWTGSEWTSDESEGLMYGESNDACIECQRLLVERHHLLPKTCFSAVLDIEYYTKQEVDVDQLRDWLFHCVILYLKREPCPQDGLVTCTIDWSKLKKE